MQKRMYSKGELKQERETKLNAINFAWSEYDKKWNDKYLELKTWLVRSYCLNFNLYAYSSNHEVSNCGYILIHRVLLPHPEMFLRKQFGNTGEDTIKQIRQCYHFSSPSFARNGQDFNA